MRKKLIFKNDIHSNFICKQLEDQINKEVDMCRVMKPIMAQWV